MTERLRESLSALMDDEADDLELGRVLRAMDEEDALVRETWSRYQLVSAVMRGIPAAGLAAARSGARYADVSAESAENADGASAFETGFETAEMASVAAQGASRQRAPARAGSSAAAFAASMPDDAVAAGSAPASRPWTSFAAAAGVTLALVVGFQWQGARDDTNANSERIVAAPADVGPVQTDPRGLLTANAGPGAQRARSIGPLRIPSPLSGATPTAAAPDARRQVDAYMLFHAEMSALNSATGMVPFARYAAFEGASRN